MDYDQNYTEEVGFGCAPHAGEVYATVQGWPRDELSCSQESHPLSKVVKWPKHTEKVLSEGILAAKGLFSEIPDRRKGWRGSNSAMCDGNMVKMMKNGEFLAKHEKAKLLADKTNQDERTYRQESAGEAASVDATVEPTNRNSNAHGSKEDTKWTTKIKRIKIVSDTQTGALEKLH